MLGRKPWIQMKNTFRGAWKYEVFESKLQYRIEAATSVIAPLLVLWATAEVSYQYWRKSDDYFWLVVIVSVLVLAFSLATLLFACSSLEAHLGGGSGRESKHQRPLRGSPMLVFAAFLFSAGAGYTAIEAIDHFFEPIGLLDSSGKRQPFDSPWGDILLAASAICMLVEEFVLLTMYDSVKTEAMRVRSLLRGDDLSKLVKEASASATKIEEALDSAERHGGDVKKYSDQAIELLTETARWQSNAQTAFGKLRASMIKTMVVMVVVLGMGGCYFYGTLARYEQQIKGSLVQFQGMMDRNNEDMERGAADTPARSGEGEEQVDTPTARDEPEGHAEAAAGSGEGEEQADELERQEPSDPRGGSEDAEKGDRPATSDESGEQAETAEPLEPADAAGGGGLDN